MGRCVPETSAKLFPLEQNSPKLARRPTSENGHDTNISHLRRMIPASVRLAVQVVSWLRKGRRWHDRLLKLQAGDSIVFCQDAAARRQVARMPLRQGISPWFIFQGS